MSLSASLVLFHNDPAVFERAISSFIHGISQGELIVMDHSSAPLRSEWFQHPRVKYVFADANPGFGAGHNKAFAMRSVSSDVHLFLNPDVRFEADVLPHLVECFKDNPAMGAIMPRVLYESGDIQHLVKLLPSPVDLIFRRFVPLERIRQRINDRYELRGLSHTAWFEAPTLSGCFLLVDSSLFERIQGFDERYFMYMEDVDLVRRIGDLATIRYEPSVHIVHAYAKGSYVNPLLLKYHLQSAFKYFCKWGWFFDATRRTRNRQALETLRSQARPG